MKGRRNSNLLTTVALSLTLLGAASLAFAQGDTFAGPNRNFDAREEARRGAGLTPSLLQKSGLDQLRVGVPGLSYRVDATTGVTRSLSSAGGFLTAPSRTDAVTTATSFLEANRALLGLDALDVAAYTVRDIVPSGASGSTHVYIEQQYAGLRVYNAVYQANMDREGRITGVANSFMPSIAVSVNALRPRISARRAVAAATEHLGIALGRLPRVLAGGKGVERVTSIDPAGISENPITARLMILPIRAAEARLVWNFQIQTLDHQHWFDMNVDADSGKIWTRFDWVASDQYKVYAHPAESPNHVQGGPLPPADGRALVVEPADPTASPETWHSGNLTEGNNVRAYEDSNESNSGTPVNCGGSRVCEFPLNLSSIPSPYYPAAVTNLFYWNNVVHDVLYQYGFDEVSGNFQEDNFGNGGLGSDSVYAEAQDGGGVDNANFSTPPDGFNPRMQMYIWNAASPPRDGDFDSGIIVHEYAHGISNRLVGGPSNVSCLSNSQQPGEGWSDWYALALTAKVGDAGTDPRGIGTYVLNQPTNGQGIRDQPYSTDPAVNSWTFESIRGALAPHGTGAVWAQALWEVYWALVDQHGFDPDIYSAAGGAGNQRALLYVTEGLKNTPCSPTFLDARDAILQAVLNTYPADECTVWQAFADFGLGIDATTTGSNSSATNGFQIPIQCQCSPEPVADAGPDEIICLGTSTTVGTPAQAGNTYSWSPGGETNAEISVFPTVTTTYAVTATTACGSANDSVTVTVDDGTGGGIAEDFEGGLGNWTALGLWHLTTDSSCASPGFSSPFNALYYGEDSTCDYSTGAANSGDLVSPAISGITSSSTLSFDYYRQVENYFGDYDWTKVDVSDDDGASWSNVWSRNARNASVGAWTSSGPISLAAYAGSTIKIRFTFDSVDGTFNAYTGWFIDNVVVEGESQCTGGNQPPVVTIDSPVHGATYHEGDTESFTATATDTEDGLISAAIGWSSSLDGGFGAGASADTVLSVGNHTVSAQVTDSGGSIGTDSISVTVNNVVPDVTITGPATTNYIEGDTVTFTGTATDSGEIDPIISWSSDLDGVLGAGSSVDARLSVGSHTVTAAAMDTEGGTGTDTLTIVVANVPPTVTIDTPTSGSVFGDGETVTFQATASDPGDGPLSSSISWSSDLDGALGSGASMTRPDLSVGNHIITASVIDSNAAPGSDSITLTVQANTAPVVSITSPADGSTFTAGFSVTFTGTSDDVEDGNLTNMLFWNSSLDGAIGGGGTAVSSLSAGSHTITASVTDSGGVAASDDITVNIIAPPNTAPVVSIDTPADGSSFSSGSNVNLSGAASDAEDGNISAGLSWSSDLDGSIGMGAAFSISTLSVGTHTITASVTDSGGLGGSDTLSVTITGGTPTTVTFTSIGDHDGWVRESSENSNAGGANSATGSGRWPIRPGDESGDRQYKAILSFDTSSIPTNATISAVTLETTGGRLLGTSPFNTHGDLNVDVRSGGFSGNAALENSDFQAAATAVGVATMSTITSDGQVSSGSFNAAGLAAVNKTGITQVRLYFDLDDNDDGSRDAVGFYSGENGNSNNHPRLNVTYTP